MLSTIKAVARETRWRMEYQVDINDALIEASIDRSDWTMHFHLDPTARKGLAALGIDVEEQKTLAKGLVRHEIGHWEICPFDSDGDHLLVEAVGKTLQRNAARKTSPQEKNRQIQFLANAIADIIVDTVLSIEKENPDYADAQALFFLKEVCRARYLHEFYHFFLQLNLALWGNRTRVTERVISRVDNTKHSKLLERALSLFPHRNEASKLVECLKDRSVWPKLASDLTEVFIQLPHGASSINWWRPGSICNPVVVGAEVPKIQG